MTTGVVSGQYKLGIILLPRDESAVLSEGDCVGDSSRCGRVVDVPCWIWGHLASNKWKLHNLLRPLSL